MIRIAVYAYGSGYRVRSHEHFGAEDDRCTPDCQNEALERCYPERGQRPHETVTLLLAAITTTLRRQSAAEVLRAAHDQPYLPLDL